MRKTNSPLVKLLADTPASEDQFERTHDRVADAIADLVQTDTGGKTIGLEGGWGSGKSTIINILRSKLPTDNYLLILFDTWAHENDPLRRTFLESIMSELEYVGWITDQDYLKSQRLTLSHQIRNVIIDSKPRLGRWGGVVAILLPFVPIGFVILNTSLRNAPSITSLDQFFQYASTSNLVWIGLLLTISPLLIVSIALLIEGLKFAQHKYYQKKGQVAEKEQYAWKFSLSSLLMQKHDKEERRESIEQPNPTSIEFSQIFSDVMEKALTLNKDRCLILTIDNLDRVVCRQRKLDTRFREIFN